MIEGVMQKLQAEVEMLHHELNVTLPEALGKAIAMGDLKENGDYHAALERQQFVQARLAHLTSRLTKLSQIDTSKIPADRVGLGSKVLVRDMDTKEEEIFELVIPDAMDVDLGHVSVAAGKLASGKESRPNSRGTIANRDAQTQDPQARDAT